MTKYLQRALPLCLLLSLGGCDFASDMAAPEAGRFETAIQTFSAETTAPASAAAAQQAAETFIGSLTTEQRYDALLPIGSPLIANWSNLPANIVDNPRNGVRIGDLSPDQMNMVLALLRAGLSQHGYDTVTAIVGADKVLSAKAMAGRLGWSDENYWIAFFGNPEQDKRWTLQFGGHHLALNLNVNGDRMSMSPTFLGIEPASFDRGGALLEPLKEEVSLGTALIQSLSEGHRTEAIIDSRPEEVVAGPGEDGTIPELAGSAVVGWSDEEKAKLIDVINQWITMMPAETARARLDAISNRWDETRFAWHGATDGSDGIYYRIQGPALLIEFSTEGAVGMDGDHYHSVYRDPVNEYGSGGD